MFDFKEKVVLITGASYGLGEQFAYDFARSGADLILTARSVEQLEEVGARCREIGSRVAIIPGDVSVEADVKNVISSGIKALGRIDVLINNAGIADTSLTAKLLTEFLA
jgi:short-subunit dehydrogenase